MFEAPEIVFQSKIFISSDVEKVFEFFSDAKNLERITPPSLGFIIKHQSTKEIQEGTEFEYKLKIHGIPVTWKSKIIDWEPNKKFADIQLKGPYKKWHHTHEFIQDIQGTTMIDTVAYQLRGGALAHFFLGTWVGRDVAKIFSHREKVIQEVF